MLNIYSDLKSLIYHLNVEQRKRFIVFLESVLNEGTNVVIKSSGTRQTETTIEDIIENINNTTEYEIFCKIAEEAASKGKTAIPEEDCGVHERHCCSKHGCKYGDVDCPVALGIAEQEEDCYVCWESRNDFIN